jgi:hypothetical protein
MIGRSSVIAIFEACLKVVSDGRGYLNSDSGAGADAGGAGAGVFTVLARTKLLAGCVGWLIISYIVHIK